MRDAHSIPAPAAPVSSLRPGGSRGDAAVAAPRLRSDPFNDELPPVPLLLRPAEVARRIGIGKTKLFELLARGEIPTIRIGRTVRIPSDLLEEWLREQVEWRRPGIRGRI